MWEPRLDPGTEKDISGKTGEICMRSGVQLIVIYQTCWFLSLDSLWECKMLALGETG